MLSHQRVRKAVYNILMFFAIIMLAGCSIPARTAVEPKLLQSPDEPVLKDVYDRSDNRSVDEDVYTRRGERLIREPSLEPEDPLRAVGD